LKSGDSLDNQIPAKGALLQRVICTVFYFKNDKFNKQNWAIPIKCRIEKWLFESCQKC
jgi:hypothetical protein